MKYLIINLMIIFMACSISRKGIEPKSDGFFITFGSCFRGGKYNVKVNKIDLGDFTLQSDFSLGIVRDYAIKWENQSLLLIKDEAIKSKQKLQTGNNIQIQISGKKRFDGLVDLSKGRYMLIDACADTTMLIINQYKKPPNIE